MFAHFCSSIVVATSRVKIFLNLILEHNIQIWAENGQKDKNLLPCYNEKSYQKKKTQTKKNRFILINTIKQCVGQGTKYVTEWHGRQLSFSAVTLWWVSILNQRNSRDMSITLAPDPIFEPMKEKRKKACSRTVIADTCCCSCTRVSVLQSY